MDRSSRVKLAEVIAALSLATDLANDNPPETTLRICLLSLELGQEMGLSQKDLADLYFASLLRFIGCTAYAPEEARQFGGDDNAVRRIFAPVDMGSLAQVTAAVSKLGQGSRLGTLVQFMARGRASYARFTSANCEVAALLGAKIGMAPGVLRSLEQVHERWDGRGGPRKTSKDRLTLAVRILHVASTAEAVRLLAGTEAACEMIRRRAGGQFDPDVVKTFRSAGRPAFERMEQISVWDEVIRRAPAGESSPAPARLREVAAAFGSFADLKSTFTRGRSAGVAALAEEAGRLMGVKDTESLTLAAYLADLGMVSVPTGVLEKKGRLSAAEWERVRLHPYYTERILTRSPILAPLAATAGMHQERSDGSGYHRGALGAQIPGPARILAAADVYHALCEERPFRAALSADQAARELERLVSAGKLDTYAAEAVLSAAGHVRQRPRRHILSEREREVLMHLARGSSNKEIGRDLGISAKTVQHHVLHIYNKIGVSTRAAAALYAADNGLTALSENA